MYNYFSVIHTILINDYFKNLNYKNFALFNLNFLILSIFQRIFKSQSEFLHVRIYINAEKIKISLITLFVILIYSTLL